MKPYSSHAPALRAWTRSLRVLPFVALLALGAALAHADGPRRAGRRTTSRPTMDRTTYGAPRLEVVAEVRTEVQPKSVALSPDGRQLWVCHFGRVDRDNVWVYDTETLDLVGRVDFEGNGVESAFHPDGRRAYVSNFRRGVVHEIDRETFAILREFRVRDNPKFMVVSPAGDRLFVANYSGASVSVVELESGETLRVLRTGSQPRGMAVLPDGRLAVASFRSDRVQLFSPSGEEVDRFDTCRYPRHLQLVTPAADAGREPLLYVTCTLGSVGVYHLDGRRTGFAPTGRNPRSLAASPDGRWAATANFGSSDVTLVDFTQLRHRTVEVPRANQLVGIALRVDTDGDEERVRVWATSWRNRRLFALEARVPRAH